MNKTLILKLAELVERSKVYHSSQQVVDEGGVDISHEAQYELGYIVKALEHLAEHRGSAQEINQMEMYMSDEARDVFPIYAREVIRFAAKQEDQFDSFMAQMKR